jgi:hypothetical protein
VQVGCAAMGRLGPLMRGARALTCRADTPRHRFAVVRDVATFLRFAKSIRGSRLTKLQSPEPSEPQWGPLPKFSARLRYQPKIALMLGSNKGRLG